MSERKWTQWIVVVVVVATLVYAVSRMGGGVLDTLRRMHGH